MKPKSLMYFAVTVFLASVVTPAFAGSPLSPQEMEAIQAGTVITSNSISAGGDASDNEQLALWLEFSNVFLGLSAQEDLAAVNNVVAADSQVVVGSNIASFSGQMGSSNIITQTNNLSATSDIFVTNSIAAGVGAVADDEIVGTANDNDQDAFYILAHQVVMTDDAQADLRAINNIVAAGSQVAAASNIVTVGQSVGSTNTVTQSNSATTSRFAETSNSLSAGHDAHGNSQVALWIELTVGADGIESEWSEYYEGDLAGLVLTDTIQESLTAINNIVAVDSQVAAGSNVVTVGTSIGSTNRINQSNDASASSEILVTNFISSSGDPDSHAIGIGFDDGDASGNDQEALYILVHGVTMDDSAQSNLQAINNIVAAGSQVSAGSNVVAIGDATGDFNDITQSNTTDALRLAVTTNEIRAGDDATGNEQFALWQEFSSVNLFDVAQHELQAINNIVAADSQVAAGSNIVAVAGALGAGGTPPNGEEGGETDNDISQTNAAVLANIILVGNTIEGGAQTLANDQLDQHGYADDNTMDAEYLLVHEVFISGEAQEELQAVNNVVAAGSQVAAQSNVITVGGSAGADDDFSQLNSAIALRLAVTRNDIIAPGEPANNDENDQNAQWVEYSFVDLREDAQAGLQAVNNVVAADSQVAAQSNVITIGRGLSDSSTSSQANVAIVASIIDVGNAISPGISLVDASGDADDNDQFARYFLFHQVDMTDSAQIDLQAVNNVVAAGSQVAAQSNLFTIGNQLGSSNDPMSQLNVALVARAANTTNVIAAGGSADGTEEEDPQSQFASWVEHSFIFMEDGAQIELQAVNNVVAADSQVAAQSNLVAVGQSVGSNNAVGQANVAIVASAIDVGNAITAGQSTILWEGLPDALLGPNEGDDTGPVADDFSASDNDQYARYILVHGISLTDSAQSDLRAVNNVVASGSQVAAQSNILTVGGTFKAATVGVDVIKTEGPSIEVPGLEVEGTPVEIPSVDPTVPLFRASAELEPSLSALANLDSGNSAGQANVAIVAREADTTNSIVAGGDTARNSQTAIWWEFTADVEDHGYPEYDGATPLLVLTDDAQSELRAINNVVAADSQVAAQSNIFAVGGTVGSANTASQVNVAIVASAVDVGNSLISTFNPDAPDEEIAAENTQFAQYLLIHPLRLGFDDGTQDSLQAINNVVAVGSQVAAQSNITAIGNSIGSNNAVDQANIAIVARSASTTNTMVVDDDAASNLQTAEWLEFSDVTLGDFQEELQAVNNVLAADSQVAAQSNIVTIGGSAASGNIARQANLAVVASAIDVGNSFLSGGDAFLTGQTAIYVLEHAVFLFDDAQVELRAINNVIAAGSEVAAQSNLLTIGGGIGNNNAAEQVNAAAIGRTAFTSNSLLAFDDAVFNFQDALWAENSDVVMIEDAQEELEAVNNVVAADSQVAAQSNIVTVGGGVGNGNTSAQVNAAVLGSDIDVGNDLIAVRDAFYTFQDATYTLSHAVFMDDDAQEDLQAINNVVAAGSQVAAQSNIATVGQGVGSSNTAVQVNAADMDRTAFTTNFLLAFDDAVVNFQDALWAENSDVEMTDDAQKNLEAVNNVVAADSQAAAQSNIVTVGQGVGNSNTAVQANAAAMDIFVDTSNSLLAFDDAVFNFQDATYTLYHGVQMDDDAQEDLQAVNNVVAAGSQVAAQSNIITVGSGIGDTTVGFQFNEAEIFRSHLTFNTLLAFGDAVINFQDALWEEASRVSMFDDAQEDLQAINNVVAAGSQVAAQSNIVTVGGGVGNSNTAVQANASQMVLTVFTGNTLLAFGDAVFNFQDARYILAHEVTIEETAQRDLQAVNNVVAAGSQVAAQSNIVTVGQGVGSSNTAVQANSAGMSRFFSTGNSIFAETDADLNVQVALWLEGDEEDGGPIRVLLVDDAQRLLDAINNVVAAHSQVAAQSNLVTVGQGVGSTNTATQGNFAGMDSFVSVGNFIFAFEDADDNDQEAVYSLFHEVHMQNRAQRGLQAVNNVVATGSQAAAQSNILTAGGGAGNTNTALQVNAAAMFRGAFTGNGIFALDDARGDEEDSQSQRAFWVERSAVILWDDAQEELQAINNVVAADSQVAAQSNIATFGNSIGDSNTLAQVNTVAMSYEIEVSNSIVAGDDANHNDQLASYFLAHAVELRSSAQESLRAINNVVSAGSQVGAASNIATVGGNVGSSNTITQTNAMSVSR